MSHSLTRGSAAHSIDLLRCSNAAGGVRQTSQETRGRRWDDDDRIVGLLLDNVLNVQRKEEQGCVHDTKDDADVEDGVGVGVVDVVGQDEQHRQDDEHGRDSHD